MSLKEKSSKADFQSKSIYYLTMNLSFQKIDSVQNEGSEGTMEEAVEPVFESTWPQGFMLLM